MSYDDWKTATPPGYDEQHSAGCDGVHDDDAGDRRCTVCYWQPDADDDDDSHGPERECECPRNRFNTQALDDAIGFPCDSCGGIVR